MMDSPCRKKIGYACAYTPIALIHAAGFDPYRILPEGSSPYMGGGILHDNLCPHIKRVLDRAIARDLPPLAGMVFMNSCDSMRRLFDAWQRTRPDIPSILLELPVTAEAHSVAFFELELHQLSLKLSEWGGNSLAETKLQESMELYNILAENLANRRPQSLINRAMTVAPEDILVELKADLPESARPGGVPIYLFGNILSDSEAFQLFEDCGAKIVGDDLCTSSRSFQALPLSPDSSSIHSLAQGLLSRRPCARTMVPGHPEILAENLILDARATGAKGVIGHTVKFCDPYLARVPMIRERLKRAKIPFLFLEGDCTLGTIGQQRTRIEAFVEMLT
ncbi:MAG: 2-hydroxyacyl-CoA dehydratase [Bdellovibrio sp.]|nr:2-hydroxyacyl-CoA dehydratase [Bdellovibrio sp.]